MNALLAFSPLLALVAFMSAEVSAESFAKYSDLEKAGFVNGFDFQFTVNVETPFTVSTTGDMDGCTVKELGTCSLTPATWDNKDTIDITADIPAGVEFPEGSTPEYVEFRLCFAQPSTVNRKWRKINDSFKKDNSCKNGATAKVDWAEGPLEASLKLKSVTPTALFSIRAYVTCEGAGKNDYCHIVNYQKDASAEGKLYFNTEVMDSRPNNLFVAVIICSLIGPLMLAAFLVYERGILAKQA